MLFGEQILTDGREHLHYIDGIRGELYYLLDGKPYRLTVIDREVRLERYEETDYYDVKQGTRFERITDRHLEKMTATGEPMTEEYAEFERMKHYIDAFFYTVVSNYSIFAYNTLDYPEENNSEDYERKILRHAFGEDAEGKMKIDPSERNWLFGIFHKNDGYKTPLVLTPYRNQGKLNINIENTLSRERFISLFLRSGDMEGGGFRRINNHLETKRFRFVEKDDYGREYVNESVDIKALDEYEYGLLNAQIKMTWEAVFLDDLDTLDDNDDSTPYKQIAFNYLTYKTIKIATKYKDYEKYGEIIADYLNTHDEQKLVDGLYDYVGELKDDRSHITRKIRQTLAFILTVGSECIYSKEVKEMSVSDIAQKTKVALKGIRQRYGDSFYVRDIDDMLPPPFLDTQILLEDIATGNGQEEIAFSTLSSGEKQQIYSVSSLLYHLLNINSVSEDKAHKRFPYHYVNLILEEVELYFHPDFQKRYIQTILDGISQLDISNIKGINLCFVTHSPFILSDIPRNNLLILDNGIAKPTSQFKTFGANIYDMLKNSFFLEGTPIGCYAQWLITRIIVMLGIWKLRTQRKPMSLDDIKNPKLKAEDYDFLQLYNDSRLNGEMVDGQLFVHYSSFWLNRKIELIDEPFVKASLMREFYDTFPAEYDRQREIAELEERLRILKEE